MTLINTTNINLDITLINITNINVEMESSKGFEKMWVFFKNEACFCLMFVWPCSCSAYEDWD